MKKKEKKERDENEILITVLKELTGYDFTNVEVEIIMTAIAADYNFKNVDFYNKQAEEKELKTISLLKNYRKVKQR